MNFYLRQQMLLTVRALYFCMEHNWSELGRRFEISPAQQHILFLLSTHNNTLTPTQIGELGCWHISTVTRLLKPLQQKELVTVKKDKNTSKYKIVSMTVDGKKLINSLFDAAKTMELFPFDLRYLSEEEVLSFLECGKKILDVHKGENFRFNVISAKVEGGNYG
ncbi:MarR family transcriptional regulator [Bacillus sp. HMF5848]|uniref:MarR family transcriptional regulator n=1 Tax=Bacillus sp. HMF5848 TaxID=2495421 RepID=UPI000F77CBFE|nr:MarR family transcriptional regulator [Bacillus sp. HMF5848]RSK28831.1 MarR family transcriptional regulator [Bacillus sp. HMF5848]